MAGLTGTFFDMSVLIAGMIDFGSNSEGRRPPSPRASGLSVVYYTTKAPLGHARCRPSLNKRRLLP